MNKISVALAATIFASTSAFAGSHQVGEKELHKLKPPVMNQKAAGNTGAKKTLEFGTKPGRGLEVRPESEAEVDNTATGSTAKRLPYPPSPWFGPAGFF